jgi:hypothetical protein
MEGPPKRVHHARRQSFPSSVLARPQYKRSFDRALNSHDRYCTRASARWLSLLHGISGAF